MNQYKPILKLQNAIVADKKPSSQLAD
jgi:hypothetical protein